jgi:urease accessory protein UreE
MPLWYNILLSNIQIFSVAILNFKACHSIGNRFKENYFMYEEYRVPLSETQINAYLKRLNIAKETPSLDYLNRIIKAQLRTIPFDDADRAPY